MWIQNNIHVHVLTCDFSITSFLKDPISPLLSGVSVCFEVKYPKSAGSKMYLKEKLWVNSINTHGLGTYNQVWNSLWRKCIRMSLWDVKCDVNHCSE